MHQRTAYVFFATGDWCYRRRRLTWWQRLRIARRFPRRSYRWALSWMIRRVSRSRLAHVALGDGEVVLESLLDGDRNWPHIAFVLRYPTLVGYYVVPVGRPVDVQGDPSPKAVWPTLLNWWTRGRWHTNDCVCTTVGRLRAAGVDVPARVWNPAQLFDWLQRQGYEYEHLS